MSAPPAFSPEQYQAMRDWLIHRQPPYARGAWRALEVGRDDSVIAAYVNSLHPGGLTAFLAQHPTEETER